MTPKNEPERVLRQSGHPITGPGNDFSRRQFLKLIGITIAGISAWVFYAEQRGLGDLDHHRTGRRAGRRRPNPLRGLQEVRTGLHGVQRRKGIPEHGADKGGSEPQLRACVFTRQYGQGNWGNGLIIQDIVQAMSPSGAVRERLSQRRHRGEAADERPGGGCRQKCIGCKMCQRACPWEMMSFDRIRTRPQNVFYAMGTPSASRPVHRRSLTYVAWRESTGKASTEGGPDDRCFAREGAGLQRVPQEAERRRCACDGKHTEDGPARCCGLTYRPGKSQPRIPSKNTEDYMAGTGIGYKVIWDEVSGGNQAVRPGKQDRLWHRPVGRDGRSLQWKDRHHDACGRPAGRGRLVASGTWGPVCRRAEVCRVRCRHHRRKGGPAGVALDCGREG